MHVDRYSPETLDRVIETLKEHVTPARMSRIERVLDARTREVVIVLEDLLNEHNTAAALRTAEAFGFFEVHVIGGASADAFQVSARVSSGSHKWLDLRRHKDAREAYASLAGRGFKIFASDVKGGAIEVGQIDISTPVALVFGNEHRGISREASTAAHGRFLVPMVGFVESFNVSVAVALSAYDLSTRRRAAGRPAGLSPEDRRRVLAAYLTRSVKASRAILERAQLPVPVLSEEPVLLIDEHELEGLV